MLAIACCRIGLSVRESVWVENPDIKEGGGLNNCVALANQSCTLYLYCKRVRAALLHALDDLRASLRGLVIGLNLLSYLF